MKLTEVKVRNAKPKEKPYKLSDGDGLYLLVHPAGHKYWRMKYRFGDKEKLLALGTYPEISLADARERRFEARKLKANGVDPSQLKKEQRLQDALNSSNSFETVAHEWIEKKSNTWTPYYTRQVTQRFEKDIFPKIGHRPVGAITSRELLLIAQTIEQRDAIEIAHRAVQICGQVFQYAIITDRAENNPATSLRGALKTKPVKHRAHIEQNDLPEYLNKLEKYNGGLQTKLALKLILLTFVRPSELRCATWSEIDFDKKEWRIPAERMKMRTPHIVPLSSQAVEILKTLKKLNGQWQYVFPSTQSPRKCMSSNAMLFALWQMGYRGKATVHGFRGTASTILNESGLFGKDVIERQLSHQERSRVRAAYEPFLSCGRRGPRTGKYIVLFETMRTWCLKKKSSDLPMWPVRP